MSEDTLTFESAQRELEEIVEQLESGRAGLDEAIALWQRGEELYAFCRGKLDAAEGEIEELAKRAEALSHPPRTDPIRIAPMPATVEQLQRVPLFSDLDSKELQSLASSFKERTFNAGETVASEGAGGVGFFVIDEGEAEVTRGGEEQARLGPGDYFGELALIDEGTRTATITAETDMRCYGLTSWEFRPLVENNSQIAWKLLQALAKQLREART